MSLGTVITASPICVQFQLVLAFLGVVDRFLVLTYFFSLHAYVISVCVDMDMSESTRGGPMKSLDSLELESWTVSQFWCWELNSGPPC